MQPMHDAAMLGLTKIMGHSLRCALGELYFYPLKCIKLLYVITYSSYLIFIGLYMGLNDTELKYFGVMVPPHIPVLPNARDQGFGSITNSITLASTALGAYGK